MTLFQDVGVVGVVRRCAEHRFQDHGGGIGVVAFCGEGGELLEQRMGECLCKIAERRKVGGGGIGDLAFGFVRLDEGAVDGLAVCEVAQDCLRQVCAERILRSCQGADRCVGFARSAYRPSVNPFIRPVKADSRITTPYGAFRRAIGSFMTAYNSLSI